MPSVSLNNYFTFCNNSSDSLRFVSVKKFALVFIHLFKSSFLYLLFKIVRNHIVEVHNCSDLYISSA